jgi:hypothetical protein
MADPRPTAHFLDLLLKSEEVMSACKAEFGEKSADVIDRAKKGDSADFLEWFEEWRTDRHEDIVFQLEGAAPYNDTFWININRSGPLYWIRAVEFDDECYFDSEKDAIEYAEDNFGSFITALAERRAEEDR